MTSDRPLPASRTKHLSNLLHPLPPPHSDLTLNLRQISSTSNGEGTGTTGTTLWLSSQILSLYLSSVFGSSSSSNTKPKSSTGEDEKGKGKGKKKVVLELGSGTGYNSLNILALGYKVISTDIEPVLSGVLRPNIENNLRVLRNSGLNLEEGDVYVEELDWMNIASLYDNSQIQIQLRNNDQEIGMGMDVPSELDYLKTIDMIIMSDTFYSPTLTFPLWKTLLYISRLTPTSNKPPIIYISLERRDPTLIDAALDLGREMGFELKKVNRSRLSREMQSSKWGWKGDDWEGVEVWKCRWRG
ncbi:hypothetical protein I302_100529 [Kwoniella bestiolae CBS 10118]|uniref:Elongation factor methyltransferase 7 n=1 Tax=Kwoniella bestiolae CBS 10118 TaxID=1296100 RepID=A0A1B9G5B7_9TREE|nr:hypothetical protein I302_03903 [Kwoniella bestiolae CBS 10118]OCF26224.1 hypothetical protein I302_03903 [Kwoniella bestiolae CBS 10118]